MLIKLLIFLLIPMPQFISLSEAAVLSGKRQYKPARRSRPIDMRTKDSPFSTASTSPFMFLQRNAINNPVFYLHSGLVNQLVIIPCYLATDSTQFAYDNGTDMAWYRRLESVHNPRAFPSISDSQGRILILEPLIGYSWYLCDTAFTAKLKHAQNYNQFYNQFNMGQLKMDWNYYQDFSEFNKGQFKHYIFVNELSVTEIFIFMNASMTIQRTDIAFEMEQMIKPEEIGLIKITLLRILEAECRDNPELFCENPTVDLVLPIIDSESSITMQSRMKMYLSNERLLKLGADSFIQNRKNAIKRISVKWDITSQSVDLGGLNLLNRYPMIFKLSITSMVQAKSDCVGSGSYLSVKYDWECVLCRPGYYLENQPWVQAASETNSICHLCPVGSYSSEWGSVVCHECPPGQTTREVGSTAVSKCIPTAAYELENNIKELLTYFRVRAADDYKKYTLLAAILLAPWVLFVIFLLVTIAYDKTEISDAEHRFKLERELGRILLQIRRNYNTLVDEDLRL